MEASETTSVVAGVSGAAAVDEGAMEVDLVEIGTAGVDSVASGSMGYLLLGRSGVFR